MKSPSIEEVRQSRSLLQNPYAHIDYLYPEVPAPLSAAARPEIDLELVINSRVRRVSYLRSDIEGIAGSLHRQLWRKRAELLPPDRQGDPVALLDPELVLRKIGYEVSLQDSLGFGYDSQGQYEVAGTINRPSKQIELSRQLPLGSRRFTAAHELAHALLHSSAVHHRDRSTDGAARYTRDRQELEADLFATEFLMPRNLVRDEFRARFGTEQFSLEEFSAVNLGLSSAKLAKKQLGSRRDVSRHLAEAKIYGGRAFYSMSERFLVSAEAMAIRLEELQLVRV